LTFGTGHPEVAGIVCINPATQPQAPEVMEVLHGMASEGVDHMPGIGADIADPDATESAYDETPLKPLISLVEEGLAPMSGRYGEITCPLLLLTSPQDHVVDPGNGNFLAETFGGPLERISLERSYHVATLDYDKDVINDAAVAFGRKVTG